MTTHSHSPRRIVDRRDSQHLGGPEPRTENRTPLATANVQYMFYSWERHPQLYALLEPMG